MHPRVYERRETKMINDKTKRWNPRVSNLSISLAARFPSQCALIECCLKATTIHQPSLGFVLQFCNLHLLSFHTVKAHASHLPRQKVTYHRYHRAHSGVEDHRLSNTSPSRPGAPLQLHSRGPRGRVLRCRPRIPSVGSGNRGRCF